MSAIDVQVTVTRGEIGQAVRDRARQLVTRAVRPVPSPILRGRVALAVDPDPAVEWPARATVALDVGGRVVLARAAAATPDRAVRLLAQRLRAQLVKRTRLWMAPRRQARAHRAAPRR